MSKSKLKVYTLGYYGRDPEQVLALAERLDATVFDCRFSPRSRDPRWSGKRLSELMQSRYRHVRQFGNRNYKGGPIELVDYPAGIQMIEAAGNNVILMCVCKDYKKCHRTTIAVALESDGYETYEIGEIAVDNTPQLIRTPQPESQPAPKRNTQLGLFGKEI